MSYYLILSGTRFFPAASPIVFDFDRQSVIDRRSAFHESAAVLGSVHSYQPASNSYLTFPLVPPLWGCENS